MTVREASTSLFTITLRTPFTFTDNKKGKSGTLVHLHVSNIRASKNRSYLLRNDTKKIGPENWVEMLQGVSQGLNMRFKNLKANNWKIFF